MNYTFTKYPLIYKLSYWGRCVYPIDERVIRARNQFIKDFQIVSYINTKKERKKVSTYFDLRKKLNLDHTEYYVDELGRHIYIYSKYGKIADGFKLYKPMYNYSDTTGVKIIETTKSRKKLIEQVLSPLPDDMIAEIYSFLNRNDRPPKKKSVSRGCRF